jgi:ADP-ribose pyrophosphatase
LPDGSERDFTFVEHPGFVSIVPLTSAGEVLLIRSYRYPVDAQVLEVPAGGLGNSGDRRADQSAAESREDPFAGARALAQPQPAELRAVALRELREETGHVAGDMEAVGSYWSAIGNSSCRAYVYLARDVRPDGDPQLEATESIEVLPTPIEEALRMARDGRIEDGHSALALLWCEERLRAAAAAGPSRDDSE